MSGKGSKTNLYIPSDSQLTCPKCHFERWSGVNGLTHLSRRKLVQEIEQFFAKAFDIEFRFAETSESYCPGFCWPDVSARNVSYTLKRIISSEQSEPVDIRDLEKERQVDTYLRCSISQYAAHVRRLGQEHEHPGWERL